MASNAVERIVGDVAMTDNLADEPAMASQAVVLEDRRRARVELNRVVEILEREAPRVPIAVLHLRRVFADQVVRHVAIVADGDSMVAGVLPTVVLLAHEVAVYTRGRIVGEVRPAFGGVKREAASAGEYADESGEGDSGSREQASSRGAWARCYCSSERLCCTTRLMRPRETLSAGPCW